jgi:ribosomal-protein-alanine N-acetyltransferase
MNFSDYFSEFPFFSLNTCNLRKIDIKDANALYKYYNNKNVYQHLDWYGPSSIDNAVEIINHWNNGYKDGWIIRFGIVTKDTNELIGTIFLNSFDGKRSEIGYELSQDHWRKGIMSEVVNTIIHFGFETLKRTRIQATVCHENTASEQLLLKNGFQLEGILRQYEEHYVTKEVKDMKLYSIIKEI